MSKGAKKVLLGISKVLTVIVIVFLVVLIFLSVREYRPKETEVIKVSGESHKKIQKDQEISILTWNVGYGALSETEDFFMDGGKTVRPDNASLVKTNIQAMKKVIKESESQIIFLQEVDHSSKRSYKYDEVKAFSDGWNGISAYARNFYCDYIPYPFPTIGKVDGGLVTLSQFETYGNAQRIALPTPFAWPIRTCQLKRCLLLERMPVKGSNRQVVFVNLHLEAYDDGEGKAEQTKFLAKVLEEEYKAGNYVIAGGDFNQTFQGLDASKYPVWDDENFQAGKVDESEFDQGWQFAVDDTLPTCRLLNKPYDRKDPKTQFYVIDGFILSPNVELKEIKVLDEDFKNSDHNPVQMKVKLK